MAEIAWLGLMLLCFLLGAGFGWWRGYRHGKMRGWYDGFDRGVGKHMKAHISADQRARESGII